MFLYITFTIIINVISVLCTTSFEYTNESAEDPVVYYDDDASQDSGDLYLRHMHTHKTTEDNISCDNTTEMPVSLEKIASTTRKSYQHKAKVKNYTNEPKKYQESRNAVEVSNEDPQTLINYPYVVSINRRGAHYATAALVGKRWVISVAAEFFNVRESIKQFKAVLGSVNCKRGTSIPLKRIEIHPSFAPGWPVYDVALVQLAWSVQYSAYIQPIPLSTAAGQVNSAKYLTVYWPRIVVKDRVLPPNAPERKHYNSLRVSTQTLIPLVTCTDLMRKLNSTLDSSLLCLNPVTEFHTKCMADPGAPVVAEGVLWGVTSGWSPAACAASARRTPAVFTRLATYNVKQWIDTIVSL